MLGCVCMLRMCVCVCAYLCARAFVCLCVRRCVCVCARPRVRARMHVCACVRALCLPVILLYLFRAGFVIGPSTTKLINQTWIAINIFTVQSLYMIMDSSKRSTPFLISNVRRVPCVVYFLLGNSRRLNFICRRFGTLCLFCHHRQVGVHLPAYEDGTERSETSAYKIQTPGNYPEETIHHTEHGESLKSWFYFPNLVTNLASFA